MEISVFIWPAFVYAIATGFSVRIVWLKTHGLVVPKTLSIGRYVAWIAGSASMILALSEYR